MTYSLAIVFIIGGVSLASLSFYFYKQMQKEEKKQNNTKPFKKKA